MIILPGQGKSEARVKIERTQRGLVDEAYLREEKVHVHIPASLGLAADPDDAKTMRDWLAAAAPCLFQRKERGKSRITVFKD